MIQQSETIRRKAEAQKYIRQVINQMSLADSDLKRFITKHVRQLIEVSISFTNLGKSFHFTGNPELETQVNEILGELRKDLFNIIYLRADNVSELAHQKEKQEKPPYFLLTFITMQIAGFTLEYRINRYVNMMRSEVEAFVATGIVAGLSRNQILVDYINWLKTPYAAPLLLNAFRTQGFTASRIKSKGITFGKGKYKSAYNNLLRLEQDTVFRAYNHTLQELWQSNTEITGWYTVRGSTYPCDLCNDMTGQFHPKDEPFFGYHSRCCCIMLPVYVSDIAP